MNTILNKKFEILLIILFFVFSWWLMDKSFGYDVTNHLFRVARHQVGDFGLHLSLIRSFSLGDNIPAESPFYPGKPLPYHYFFDLVVGILERFGTRIDVALNGVSIVFFTALLFFIYKLPQIIFKKSKILGLLSAVLFIFHSNFTFIDFIKETKLTSLLHDLWYLPDYLHKGPFDGSLISIFFTLNVFLNQRHFIAALAISFGILYFFLKKVINAREISVKSLILIGLILGIISRFHTLTFFSSSIIIFLLLMLFKKYRFVLPLFIPAAVVFSLHLKDILNQQLTHPFINPGFLAAKPLTLESFGLFWILNLGLAVLLAPLGFMLSNTNQKKIFLSIFALFVVGNIFQLSFRIEHNHSLFNYFLIFANFYIAFLLIKMWTGKVFLKLTMIFLIFFLTISGFIDLMAVKNDYQLVFPDTPRNKFMEWIKTNTGRNDIFISRQEILDPITLSGRKNFLGHKYYLTVMGYESSTRESLVKEVFEVDTTQTFEKAKGFGVKFIAIPQKKIPDFNYRVNVDLFKENLNSVYQDEDVIVFKL